MASSTVSTRMMSCGCILRELSERGRWSWAATWTLSRFPAGATIGSLQVFLLCTSRSVKVVFPFFKEIEKEQLMANRNLSQGWMGHQNRLKFWGGRPSLVVVLGRGDVQASTAPNDSTKSVGNSVCKHGPSSTVFEEISKVGTGRLRGMAG